MAAEAEVVGAVVEVVVEVDKPGSIQRKGTRVQPLLQMRRIHWAPHLVEAAVDAAGVVAVAEAGEVVVAEVDAEKIHQQLHQQQHQPNEQELSVRTMFITNT